jgi:hypothetical protein
MLHVVKTFNILNLAVSDPYRIVVQTLTSEGRGRDESILIDCTTEHGAAMLNEM